MKPASTTSGRAIQWILTLMEVDPAKQFKQGRYRLKNKGGYCCLGVANEIHKMGEPAWASGLPKNKALRAIGLKGLSSVSLSNIGLPFYGQRIQGYLAYLNDERSLTFPLIGLILIKHCDVFFIPTVARDIKRYFNDPHMQEMWEEGYNFIHEDYQP